MICGQCDCVLVAAHASAAEKSCHGDLARAAPQRVAALDFADPLELLKTWIECEIVRKDRQIEQATTQSPVTLVPLGGGAKRIAPWLGCVIEGSCIDDCPVQKIVARIMSVFVVVEDVGDAEFSDRYHQAVGRLATGELIDAGINLLRFAAKIDGLTDECALQSRVGVSKTDLVGFTARVAGDSERVANAKSLIDFRVEPKLCTLP